MTGLYYLYQKLYHLIYHTTYTERYMKLLTLNIISLDIYYNIMYSLHTSHYLPTWSDLNVFVAVSLLLPRNFIPVAIFPLTLLVQLSARVLLKIECSTCKVLHFIFTSSVVNVISQVLLTPVGGVTGNFREPFEGVQYRIVYPQS